MLGTRLRDLARMASYRSFEALYQAAMRQRDPGRWIQTLGTRLGLDGRDLHVRFDRIMEDRGDSRANPPPTEPTSGLTEEEFEGLRAAARHPALKKFLRGVPLTAADADGLWRTAPAAAEATTGAARRAAFEDLLTRTLKATEREENAHFGGRWDRIFPPGTPSLSTVYGLYNLSRLLAEKFPPAVARRSTRRRS